MKQGPAAIGSRPVAGRQAGAPPSLLSAMFFASGLSAAVSGCGTLLWGGVVKILHGSNANRNVRNAAWVNVAPHTALRFLIFAIFGLAAFLVCAQIALVVRRHLGA